LGDWNIYPVCFRHFLTVDLFIFIVLVSHAICYSLNAIWSYITELVCYTYFHCFFNTECRLLLVNKWISVSNMALGIWTFRWVTYMPSMICLLLNVSIYSENRRGIYFSPPKRLKHGRQNITLHWINSIIRNNKCIFTKLNAVFILKTAEFLNQYSFICSKFYKLYKYNINISHNKTTGLRNSFNNLNVNNM
jgi:hypothetical protein